MRGFDAGDHRNARVLRMRFCWMLPVVALSAGLLMFGCSEKEPHRALPEVPVKTAVAVQKNVPVEVSAIGTVEAYSVVNITSMVNGQIVRVNIKEGQRVQKGALLFDIDERPYAAALESARATLSRDRIQLLKAIKDARRYAILFKKDYVTKDQAEQTQTNAEALEATVKGDEAAVRNAALNVAYCRITAPITGRAGSILVTEGNIVKANDTTTPLMVINRIQPVYVHFSLPEQRLPEIQNEMRTHQPEALASPPGKPNETRKGRLTFVNNTIDPNTGTIDLKATFDNSDLSLWPGQFVNVLLLLGTRSQAVVVPSAAIQMGQEGNFVFVVKKDGTVESRNVTPGPQIDDQVVIDKGLSAGETVVTDGQLRLFPGVKVTVANGPVAGGDARQ